MLTVAVWHRAIVSIRRIYGALLSETWSRALIVLWVRTTIVAVDGLTNWRGALHHVGRLAGHCGSAVGDVPVRLRRHGLGATGHGRAGAEDVCEGGFPCARGLAMVLAARIVRPLLVAVVGHVSSVHRGSRLSRAFAVLLGRGGGRGRAVGVGEGFLIQGIRRRGRGSRAGTTRAHESRRLAGRAASHACCFPPERGRAGSEGGCGRGQGGGVLQRRVNRATAPAVEGTSRPARGEGEAAGARSPWSG